jgi:putative membrane protein
MAPDHPPEKEEPQQIMLMRQVVEMAAEQTRLSVERNEQSETRCYHNAERTLSVWVRTALAMMVFGIAIDRFALLLHGLPDGATTATSHHTHVLLNSLSTACGMALVALGILMTLTTGIRFLAYARVWRRHHQLPPYHGPYLAPFFALMVAIFGSLLLLIMILFAG